MVHSPSDCAVVPVGGVDAGQGIGIGLDVEAGPVQAPRDDFGRLVRLVRENERLLAELEQVRGQVRRAWAYLAEPASNAGLALARLDQLRMRRSALLAHFRANRVEARALLGSPPPGDEQIELN